MAVFQQLSESMDETVAFTNMRWIGARARSLRFWFYGGNGAFTAEMDARTAEMKIAYIDIFSQQRRNRTVAILFCVLTPPLRVLQASIQKYTTLLYPITKI